MSWYRHGQLRGCLGTLEPQPLSAALASYAIASATRDGRFSPITLAELSSLSVTVSLLSNFEPVDQDDWEIGLHGIIIHYDRYKATFLPQVAMQKGNLPSRLFTGLYRME